MKELIKESFSLARGEMVMKKFFRVLQKKLHKKINYSEFPIKYKNKWGKFAGYAFSVGTDTKKIYRLNFKLSDTSYNFSSYDMFTMMKTQIPRYTVDLTGLNVIQVLDILVNDYAGEIGDSAYIMEESTKEEGNKLEEKGTYNKADYALARLEKFANAKEIYLKNLQAKPLSDVYNDYVNWETDPDALPFYIFTKTAKMFLVKRGMTNKTFRKRKKGSRERVIEDESLNLQFQQEIEDIGWEEKFEMLEVYLDMISNASAQSLIVSGSPGSGKTEHTMSYFKKNKVEIHLFKGGVKGINELVQILYKYRENAIIVFDDCDVLLKGKDTVNIMKAALENQAEREITWVSDKSLDKNPKSKGFVPPRFTFTSGIVFLSNETNFDPAIRSRSLNVEINLTNTQMIDKMTKTASKFHPEIGMKEKLEVLNYLTEVASGVRAIDYRGFECALMLRMAQPQKWKKWTLMNLMQM